VLLRDLRGKNIKNIAFLLSFVYYITKGVKQQRMQNFLESPDCHTAPI